MVKCFFVVFERKERYNFVDIEEWQQQKILLDKNGKDRV